MDAARTQKTALIAELDAEYNILQIFADLIAEEGPLSDLSGMQQWLNSLAKTSSFIDIYMVFPDGQALLNDSGTVNFSDKAYFQSSLDGTRSVARFDNGEYEEAMFALSVPVIVNEEVIGVLVGLHAERTVRDVLVSEAYQRSAYSYICDSTGKEIVGSDSPDYLFNKGQIFEGVDDLITAIALADPEVAAQLSQSLLLGETGVFNYETEDGLTRYVAYTPLDINDWFIFESVDGAVITNAIKEATTTVIMMLIIVILWTIFAFVLLVYFGDREQKALLREQKKLEIFQQAYRIVAKHSNRYVMNYDISTDTISVYQGAEQLGVPEVINNAAQLFINQQIGAGVAAASLNTYLELCRYITTGMPEGNATIQVIGAEGKNIWLRVEFTTVFENDNQPVYVVISLTDVTEQRQKEVVYEKWKQEIAALPKEKATIIEWNLSQDRPEPGSQRLISRDEPDPQKKLEDLSTFNENAGYYIENLVYADDKLLFVKKLTKENLFAEFAQGTRELSWDYREATREGNICWKRYQIQMVPYPDSEDIKVYIVIRDIDEEKQKELILLQRSQTDPLTGVLNRTVFAQIMDTILADDIARQHAFMIVDIDYFKTINDNYGHAMGDTVLIDVANTLLANLREQDLIARLGGDEFVILVKNLANSDIIQRKTEEICRALNKNFEAGPQVSCSIGIALAPAHGKSFAELYPKADAALYAAKADGRNIFRFYQADMKMYDDSRNIIGSK